MNQSLNIDREDLHEEYPVGHFLHFPRTDPKQNAVCLVHQRGGPVRAFFSFYPILSYGDILRIFMDLGLVGIEASGLIVLMLGLAVTYTTEMDQKAIFLQLAKPVTRGEYLLGRILGFYLMNALVVLLGMAAVVIFLVVFIGGGQSRPCFILA